MAGMRQQPPWATDDQWAHVRQATGGGKPIEGGITAQGLQSTAPPSRAPSSSSISSLSFKQKMKPTMAQNPYEGALGPTIGEGAVTASNFSRLDISKVIKTKPEVWKQGKEPTVPLSKTPGQNFELRAAQRRSPRSKLKPADKSDNSEGPSEAGSPIPVRGSLPGVEVGSGSWRASTHRKADAGVDNEKPRSRSAMGMLENSGISYISASQGTVEDARARLAKAQNPLSELQQQEIEVLNMKAHLSRLEQIRSDKEEEIRKLKEKHQINDKEVAQAREVDKGLEDFRQRVELRIAATEGRLPELTQQRNALEESVRRLKLVNKGLTWRLNQGKEEQRVYQTDLKDMSSLSRDVVASKESTLQSLAQMKAQMAQDQQRREQDLARRQHTVEKMLRETKLQAERLKEEKSEKEKETAEKAAEEELAVMLAEQNGTSAARELEALRQRRLEEKTKDAMQEAGIVAEKMAKILEVCKTEDADEAAMFLAKSSERQQKLVEIKAALQSKAFAVRQELNAVTRQRERLQESGDAQGEGGSGEGTVGPGEAVGEQEEGGDGGGEEQATMEALLGDIEAYGEQNRQVAEAMSALAGGCLAWGVPVLARLVATSQDDAFLQRARALGRKVRGLRRRPELQEECAEECLALVQRCAEQMMATSLRGPAPAQRPAHGGGAGQVAGEDGSGRERISSLSGKQTLEVLRPQASFTMEPLDPHPGF